MRNVSETKIQSIIHESLIFLVDLLVASLLGLLRTIEQVGMDDGTFLFDY